MKKYNNEKKGKSNKKSSSYKKNNNNSKNSNNSTSSITEEERADLLNQIGILDLSSFGVYLIIYAAILNIQYLEWEKIKILDQLNESNYSDMVQDLSEVPKNANVIYLFVTAIFTGIIFNNYRSVLSQIGEERDEKEIEKAYKSVIAILLILLGTTINFEVLHS
ncbi:hypothetical protein [Clostridium sp. 1001271B_151109_B4]|uniref:hypothetical protein n=1 Tax=Clostridium sp. 1001271B_151109_B4 TaxID=2787148 RepID=UPI0018ABFB8D|nr:hypothetical protein [Clostridium sp. 1001271B_151109_B4]